MKEYYQKNYGSPLRTQTSMMSTEIKLNETFQANNNDKLNSN